jgi:cell shape-determining protein MreC
VISFSAEAEKKAGKNLDDSGGSMTRTIIVFLLALVATVVQAGGVYKWTDENGQLHFTDTPPPGKRVQSQTVRPASGSNSAPQSYGDLRPGEVERLKQAEQENQRENSERMRARQQSYQSAKSDEDRKRRDCDYAKRQAKYYAEKSRGSCIGSSCDYYKQARQDAEHDAFEACR